MSRVDISFQAKEYSLSGIDLSLCMLDNEYFQV